MTRITPLRRMTLQFSQSRFTEARTFINLLFHNAAFRKIERRHLHYHSVAGRQTVGGGFQFWRDVRQHAVPIGQFHPKQTVRQRFHYRAFNFDKVGHVKISGSASVTRTVCSK